MRHALQCLTKAPWMAVPPQVLHDLKMLGFAVEARDYKAERILRRVCVLRSRALACRRCGAALTLQRPVTRRLWHRSVLGMPASQSITCGCCERVARESRRRWRTR